MDEDLPVMTELKTQCLCSCDHKRKFHSQVGSEGLRTATQNMLQKQRGDYVEKQHTLHLSQVIVDGVINKFTSLFDSASYNKIFLKHVRCLLLITGLRPA
jgi:hypothetical protein